MLCDVKNRIETLKIKVISKKFCRSREFGVSFELFILFPSTVKKKIFQTSLKILSFHLALRCYWFLPAISCVHPTNLNLKYYFWVRGTKKILNWKLINICFCAIWWWFSVLVATVSIHFFKKKNSLTKSCYYFLSFVCSSKKNVYVKNLIICEKEKIVSV